MRLLSIFCVLCVCQAASARLTQAPKPPQAPPMEYVAEEKKEGCGCPASGCNCGDTCDCQNSGRCEKNCGCVASCHEVPATLLPLRRTAPARVMYVAPPLVTYYQPTVYYRPATYYRPVAQPVRQTYSAPVWHAPRQTAYAPVRYAVNCGPTG